MLRYRYRPRQRKMAIYPNAGQEGRLNKIREIVTGLVRYERLELTWAHGDEARQYAERLIGLALRYGDQHRETMEMADYWLTEKDLVHKLFKVLVPRYQNYKTCYTDLHKLAVEYPGSGNFKGVLELRGNPWPPIVARQRDYKYTLSNILLSAAKQDFYKERQSRAAQLKDTTSSSESQSLQDTSTSSSVDSTPQKSHLSSRDDLTPPTTHLSSSVDPPSSHRNNMSFDMKVKDWSLLHETSGALFPPVQEKSEWTRHRLSDEEIARFQRDGFINHVHVLSSEQCDLLLQEYRSFMDGDISPANMDLLYEYHSNQSGDEDNVLMHALGHWRISPLFHDLVFLPAVVVKVSQLLKPGQETPVRFFHDQLFAKPARHGGVVAWHQDYSYWTRTRPMQHITVHIALEDQSEENGTIKYIPGSHNWTRNGGPLPVLDFNFKDMEGIKSILNPEELDQFKPVSANLKKGEATIHHALSVHGSYSNRSDKPRRAAVLNYFADGTESNTDKEMVKGSYIPKGEKMGGQLYPMVYNPSWAV